MQCLLCTDKAVFSSPSYCKKHFICYIEARVKKTIERFHLIGNNKKENNNREKIAVAVSGGKDSQTVLYILHKLYGDRVHGIAIDEGIPGYRDKTLKDLEQFCTTYSIPFQIYSFKEKYGKTLNHFPVLGGSICNTCGVLRRYLLNEKAHGFDEIATGHNLDDEFQSIVMNLFKGNSFLSAKLGPKSGVLSSEGFTQRIKPLYLCTEKEIATYAFLQGFPVGFIECPNAADVFRSKVRDGLNELEMKREGTKLHIVETFLKLLPSLKDIHAGVSPTLCVQCGKPSMNKICKACTIMEADYVY